jgi:phospholipid/cholesterol/gamma-HCH transport system substrate-binding protein
MAEITIRISHRALRMTGIVIGGLCLALVVLHSWSSGLFLPKYSLRMYVPEAAGLAVGSPVRLDGLNAGTVNAVKLAVPSGNSERRIELTLRIEKRYQDEIRSDSTAMLNAEGLLGGRVVDIQRGFRGAPLSAGAEIAVVPTKQITLEHVINSVSKLADCMKKETNPSDDKSRTPADDSKKLR